jgi:hypothetical protein
MKGLEAFNAEKQLPDNRDYFLEHVFCVLRNS